MFLFYYKKFFFFLRDNFPKIFNLLFPYRKYLKFVISGGLAAFTTLLTLYIFTDLVGLWYVASSVFGFLAGFLVSFTFQKFWTFKDIRKDNIKIQATFYFISTLINLALNTYGIFAFVNFLGFHYLLAQFVVGILIAGVSYFVYDRLIFNRQ